jgi:hypothetical protein
LAGSQIRGYQSRYGAAQEMSHAEPPSKDAIPGIEAKRNRNKPRGLRGIAQADGRQKAGDNLSMRRHGSGSRPIARRREGCLRAISVTTHIDIRARLPRRRFKERG